MRVMVVVVVGRTYSTSYGPYPIRNTQVLIHLILITLEGRYSYFYFVEKEDEAKLSDLL